jgi:NAD(P)-dependent dehydrogenase (short-subunit alcohol dehydrogenase family)
VRVLVTGAARGLGLAFGRHLASEGAQVLGADLLEADELGFPLVRADVTSPDQVQALASAAQDVLGGLDVLINNAAVVDLARRPFWELPVDEWDRVMSVNVKGVWLTTRAVLPLLRESDRSAIVNVASEVAFSGSTGLAHYVASKGAVVSLTRALARELAPEGIRVNAIAPGYIPTEAATTMAPDGYDASRTPLGRVAEPGDLLGTLSFLASPDSSFVTGQTLLVNGGRLMR